MSTSRREIDPVDRVMRRGLWAVAALGVVLLVTGVYLSFYYRPTEGSAWSGPWLTGSGLERFSKIVVVIHRIGAYAFLAAAIAAAISAFVRARARGRSLSILGSMLAVSLPIITFALVVSGLVLPWDQVAVTSIQIGRTVTGFGPAFDSLTKFFLVGNHVMSRAAMRAGFLVHSVALPVLAAALFGFVAKTIAGGARRQTFEL